MKGSVRNPDGPAVVKQDETAMLPNRKRFAFGRALVMAYRETLGRFGQSLTLIAFVQGGTTLVAAPLLVGAFGLAASAAGISSVTTSDVGQLLRSPLGVALAAASRALTFLARLVQAGSFRSAAVLQQAGKTVTARRIASQMMALVSRLGRRLDSLLLIPYLVVLVPLAHLGTNSVLTQWVAIPAFVSDELSKEPAHAALYYGALLVIWYANVRLLFTLPLLVMSDLTARQAFARSWAMTRWRTIKVVALLGGVVVPLLLALAAVVAIAIAPVLVSDAVAPDQSSVVAAISFGVAQLATFLLMGLFLFIQANALTGLVAVEFNGEHEFRARIKKHQTPHHRKRHIVIGAGVAALTVGLLSVHAYSYLNETSYGSTTVLAHRGFTEGGVENTIEALDAANKADADVVEMDVQQTADGGWVLMHDFDLKRLARQATSVGKLTLEEATAVKVTYEQGRSGRIPSLTEYLQRADALDQQLLIEIKVHGGESPNFVPELIALIDDVDEADDHIYHTLNADVVQAFKEVRPDLRIGHILPLSYGGVPSDSFADFLVVEQGMYSRDLLDDIWAANKSLYVWTVEDPKDMRLLFRDGVDGIISDRPDLAGQELEVLDDESGFASRLGDALQRLTSPV